jgi:hypothetical protein
VPLGWFKMLPAGFGPASQRVLQRKAKAGQSKTSPQATEGRPHHFILTFRISGFGFSFSSTA